MKSVFRSVFGFWAIGIRGGPTRPPPFCRVRGLKRNHERGNPPKFCLPGWKGPQNGMCESFTDFANAAGVRGYPGAAREGEMLPQCRLILLPRGRPECSNQIKVRAGE